MSVAINKSDASTVVRRRCVNGASFATPSNWNTRVVTTLVFPMVVKCTNVHALLYMLAPHAVRGIPLEGKIDQTPRGMGPQPVRISPNQKCPIFTVKIGKLATGFRQVSQNRWNRRF